MRTTSGFPGPLFIFFLSIAAGFLPAASSAQAQKPLFPTTAIEPVPSENLLATGDFNGDGLPDTAFATAGNPFLTITILLNNGTNSAGTPVVTNPVKCTSWVYSAVTADLNNDKKLDLLFACDATYVVVLLGKGDGTFQAPVYYAVAGAGTLAPPTDFNGDGYPDVALLSGSAIPNGSVVTLLLNAGPSAPGTLLPPKSYGDSLAAGVIAPGDFNGDGKQDILAASYSGTPLETFRVLYGNGDGTFQTPVTQPGIVGWPFIVADVNEDRISDVVYVANNTGVFGTSPNLQALLGDPGGQFKTGPSSALNPLNPSTDNPFYQSLLMAESSGSKVNLAIVGQGTTSLFGDGTGGFMLGPSYPFSGTQLSFVETDSHGNLDVLYPTSDGLMSLPGAGNGTFQGPPNTPVYGSIILADFNRDGIADFVSQDSGGNLVTYLGRGDGTFSAINLTVNSTDAFFIAGDFDSDGNLDLMGIFEGNGVGHGATTAHNSSITFYKGNGDGTFQPGAAAFDLGIIGAQSVVAGDFTGNGNLDLVVGYNNLWSVTSGLLFVPGKGDGTFGPPLSFSPGQLGGQPFGAYLNADKKLDFVWGNSVYLGNGDGTFNQQPLGIPAANTSTILALGDLNGDGIPDLVVGSEVFAGNGDGTFQGSPFFGASLPQYVTVMSAAIGDVNGDGHPDLVIQYLTSGQIIYLSVNLGDGKGHFTADPNTYYVGTHPFQGINMGGPASLARLNNQAPTPANDHALDLLTGTNNGATVLLNQTNPAPKPSTLFFSSSTMLSASTTGVVPNQSLTLTVAVTGINPSGNVTFSNGSTTLGNAPLAGGVATLSVSFASAGTYSVSASYSGDSNNSSSKSNAVSISVITPDFTISISPTSATVTAGGSATTTLSFTGVGPFSGTIALSCASLPGKSSCTFAPASVTISGAQAVQTTLTIHTTAPSTSSSLREGPSLSQRLSLAFAFCLLVVPRRLLRAYGVHIRSRMLSLLLIGWIVFLPGCGSSSSKNITVTTIPGTPSGLQTISISATAAGGTTHTITFPLTVQ